MSNTLRDIVVLNYNETITLIYNKGENPSDSRPCFMCNTGVLLA